MTQRDGEPERSHDLRTELLPVLELDRLYLELAFLMMFSWICDHSLSVLHLRTREELQRRPPTPLLSVKPRRGRRTHA